ncbi:MAG: hypothetical protein N2D54_01230 [Chloroflexota bacterium]
MNTKISKPMTLIIILAFSLAACSGGGSGKSDEVVEAVGVGLPDGTITNLTITNGSVNFQIESTLEEQISFYRGNTSANGLTERTLLTSITDTSVSYVFDGNASGQAVVIQMVDLGDGSINVNIRLENV